MNIWDSVQRGLEKATQEATRRARTQRLRSTIDNLTQQIHTQEDDLLVRTMELFGAGQLTQSELLPICQELVRLQQQMEQAQLELTQIQGQLPPPSSTTQTPTYTTPPPDYQTYDQAVPAPPPPPDTTPISSFGTIVMNTPPTGKKLCTHCGVALIPGDAYCHNCGAPTGKSEVTQQPTMLVSSTEEAKASNPTPPNQETPLTNLPTAETSEPDSPTHLEEKDGGA